MSGVGRRALGRAGIVLGALILIAMVWFGTQQAVSVQRQEAMAHARSEASNQALVFEDQFRGQLLALEQTLALLERDYEASPATFDISAWRKRTLVLNDLSLHVFITDASGIIRASTRPELTGVNVSGRDYFKHEKALAQDEGAMFVGPSTRGLVTKRLQMNMTRRLDAPGGGFDGVIGISYDTQALTMFFRGADLGPRGVVGLIGTQDGQIRALVGEGVDDLAGGSISDSPMFQAMLSAPNGTWVGASAPDGLERVHGFRQVNKRDLAVIVGLDVNEAMRATVAWERGARVFAIGLTTLIVVLSAILLREMAAAAAREIVLGRDRAVLARANADLELARARADGKTAELQATISGMSDGISVVDRDLRLVHWNDNFGEFAGVDRALLKVGTTWEEIMRMQTLAGEFGDVDVEREVARRVEALRTRAIHSVVERVRPNGRTIELKRTALPDGGYVTLYSDITDRKHAETELRQARREAEEATEAKSRFVATVSHEIRAPLNTVLNSLALLAETTMSPGQQRMVNMAAQSGEALLNLISDILEMSKMEAGRLVLRPAAFTLAPVLEGVADMFRTPASERGITIMVDIRAGVPDVIQTDPGRLRQVLINLVSNAAKFAGPGMVEVTAETCLVAGSTLLRFTVSDQGPAISEEHRERLFQPFSRLEDAGAGGKPGTGLGLAICHRLALLMGGEIGCETNANDGNSFWIHLPLERAGARPDPASGDGRRLLPRTRVLLVEDIEANQIVTATILRREGHSVEIAGNGEAALAILSRRPFDYVLMDIFMPGMNGFETTRRLRAMAGPSRAVPVIALTANVSDQDRLRCLDAGMNDMLSKPIETARLLDSIAAHVWAGRGLHPCPSDFQEPAPVPVPVSTTLDADRLGELRDNLSSTILGKLVEQCLCDMDQRMPILAGALDADDARAIETEAHALAGVAGGYAMSGLDEMLRHVMSAAARGDIATARRFGAGLDAEYARARAALRDALELQPA